MIAYTFLADAAKCIRLQLSQGWAMKTQLVILFWTLRQNRS